MDLWTYLRALRRYWWLALAIPLAAGLIAFVALPKAEWETEFRAMIVFPSNPDLSGSLGEGEAIILDDTAVLMGSEVFLTDVRAGLPAEIQASLSLDDIAGMLTATRYSRVVTVRSHGDDPAVVKAIADSAEQELPHAVDTYLVPWEWARPEVPTIDHTGEPVQQTRERWIAVGTITAAACLAGLGVVAQVESLRTSYREKYGSR